MKDAPRPLCFGPIRKQRKPRKKSGKPLPHKEPGDANEEAVKVGPTVQPNADLTKTPRSNTKEIRTFINPRRRIVGDKVNQKFS